MAEILEVDGVSLRSPVLGVATRTGRYSMPARHGENTMLPGRSGTLFLKNKPFEEGVGALSIWCLGARVNFQGAVVMPTTYADRRLAFEENIAKVMRLFTRAHRLSTILAAQPDGSTRSAKVEWREWDEPEVQAGGTRAEWAIAYVIPDVWWSDVNLTTQTFSGVGQFSLTSFKDMTGVIEDGTVTITGPATNPKVTDRETGNFVQFTGDVPAGSQLILNSENASATMLDTSSGVSSSVLSQVIHGGSYRLFALSNCFGVSDTPALEFTASGTASSTRLAFSGYRKYVSG